MQIDNSPLTTSLLKEIAEVFPQVEKPKSGEITLHGEECVDCTCLRKDMDDLRDVPINVNFIRLIHQGLSCLSPKAWQWVLPYYLRYCLSDEGQYSHMETEFLVYHLSPSEEFEKDSIARLGFLRIEQIACLRHFVVWCSAHPHWKEYFPENLESAKRFLGKLAAIKSGCPDAT
jgi:hypothetical protein